MNRLFSVTLWVVIALSTPMLFLTLAAGVFIDPMATVLGVVFAVVYLTVVVWVFSRTPLWPDFRTHRRGPDGKRRRGHGSTAQWVAACLLWGGLAAVGIALLTSTALLDLMVKLNLDFFMLSMAGGYPEEIAKALGAALILIAFRQLNRPWHGLITGALVGLGFEVNENLLYGSTGALLDANSDIDGVLIMWGYRTLAGPLIHTILTAFAGYGIALALFRAHRTLAWRCGVAVGWIGIAFILHFAWNMLWESTLASIINIVVISLIMYPLFGYLIWRSWREARADESYAYAPGALTTTADLALIDAPTTPSLTAQQAEPVAAGMEETAIGDGGSR